MIEKDQAEEAYNGLFEKISKLYEATRESQVSAHWTTGQYLDELKKTFPKSTGHGKYFIKRLAEDLTRKHGKGFSITNLKNMSRFYRYFPFGQPAAQMEMSKHLLLLTVKDEEIRNDFTQRAVKENLTRFELKRLIDVYHLKNRQKSDIQKEEFIIERGSLYRYKRVYPKGLKTGTSATIDCGFHVMRNITIENIEQAGQDTLFSTEKRNDKYFIKDIIGNSSKEKNKFFTYKAWVDKIIDGDTIWLNIDMGFETIIRQKIRLRGVDTPEIHFNEGKQARDFVKRQLSPCPFVIIKTYKTDKYDRYIADLFYLKEEKDPDKISSEGLLLNNEIVSKGYGRKI